MPWPTEPKVSFFGDFFASAMNSFTDFTGRLAGTTMTKGTSATRLIGAKSLTGLKSGFFDRCGPMVNDAGAIISVWPSGADLATNW